MNVHLFTTKINPEKIASVVNEDDLDLEQELTNIMKKRTKYATMSEKSKLNRWKKSLPRIPDCIIDELAEEPLGRIHAWLHEWASQINELTISDQ